VAAEARYERRGERERERTEELIAMTIIAREHATAARAMQSATTTNQVSKPPRAGTCSGELCRPEERRGKSQRHPGGHGICPLPDVFMCGIGAMGAGGERNENEPMLIISRRSSWHDATRNQKTQSHEPANQPRRGSCATWSGCFATGPRCGADTS